MNKYKKIIQFILIIILAGAIFFFGFDLYKRNKEINRLKEQVEQKEKNSEDCYNIMTEKNAYIIELEQQIAEKDKTIQDNQSKIEELETKNKQLSNEVTTLKKN